MTLRTAAAALAVTALICLPASATAGKGSKSPVRQFTGTVASASGTTFKLRRAGHAPIKLKVSRKTKVAKGAKPRKGRKLVVSARRKRGAWVARSLKLVPTPATEDQESADDEELDDEPDAADEEEADDSDPALDLEDTLGDVFGEGDEEPFER